MKLWELEEVKWWGVDVFMSREKLSTNFVVYERTYFVIKVGRNIYVTIEKAA